MEALYYVEDMYYSLFTLQQGRVLHTPEVAYKCCVKKGND